MTVRLQTMQGKVAKNALTKAKKTMTKTCGMPISTHVPTIGKPYAKKASPTAATVGATTTGLIDLHFHPCSFNSQYSERVQQSHVMAGQRWHAKPLLRHFENDN